MTKFVKYYRIKSVFYSKNKEDKNTMLKKLLKKSAAVSIAAVMILSGAVIPSASISDNITVTASAATTAAYPSEVAIKQNTSYTCTLASSAMMIRRRMYLSGSTLWSKVTEDNARKYGWVENAGIKWDWSYSISKNTVNISRTGVKKLTTASLKKLLDAHSEGIVIYCGNIPHAVYVSGYSGNTFYCIDPTTGTGGKLADSTLKYYYKNQNTILNNVTSYWYVSSYNISNVNLSDTSLSLGKGEKYTLGVTIGFKGKASSMKWSSDNSNVATVSNGKITAKNLGTATITATAPSGKKAYCKVTVKSAPSSIVLGSKKSVTLAQGDKLKLTSSVKNGTASKTRKFTTSNKKVCTVDSSGNVKAVGVGKAVITVKTYNGKSASCTITVKPKPTSVKLSKTSVTIIKGKTAKLTATVSPSNAIDKTVTWSSSNTSVAKVTNGTITAVGGGTATITAKTYNGKTAKCTVKVTVPVTGIKLNRTTMTLEKGDSEYLDTTISPWNATDQKVTWTSSDTSVATVSNGKVTALKKGTATITAKSSNGLTAKCSVTVTVSVSYIDLDRYDIELDLGSSTTLTANVMPADADNKTVTWKSSDNSVVTVNNGVITAVGRGWAEITATTSNGISESCWVEVNVPVEKITLSKTSLTLELDESAELWAEISPDDAYDQYVRWSSTDENIVEVWDGYVYAVGEGTAVITAETSNGKKASCEVTVVNNYYE